MHSSPLFTILGSNEQKLQEGRRLQFTGAFLSSRWALSPSEVIVRRNPGPDCGKAVNSLHLRLPSKSQRHGSINVSRSSADLYVSSAFMGKFTEKRQPDMLPVCQITGNPEVGFTQLHVTFFFYRYLEAA